MVTRRTILATAGLAGAGLLAGCVGDERPAAGEETPSYSPSPTDTPPDGDSGDGNDSGGTRPEGTGGPGVTIASVAERPALPIRPTVELVDPVATDDHPPRLRVRVENGADGEITIGESRAVVFEYVTAESGELVTLPAGGGYPVESGCWRLTEGVATTEEYRTTTLGPGEALSADLELYGAATGEDACLPVGEHGFRSTYSVFAGDSPTADGSTNGSTGTEPTVNGTVNGSTADPAAVHSAEPEQGTWGFTLLLE